LRIYFSGGSPIPETSLDKPDIMLSYYVDVGKRGLPNTRLVKAMNIRKKAKEDKGRGKKRAGKI
jgi:hypothetical protein